MRTMEELQSMMNADIMQAERERLVDIRDIRIDEKMTVENRIISYMEQVENPFLVKSDDYVLQFRYASDCDKTMSDRLLEYVSKMVKLH